MFGFKKENKIDEARDKLESFGDIGDTFQYLDRTCVITAHHKLVPMVGIVPVLCADYSDNNGVIRNIEFLVWQIKLLKPPTHTQRHTPC